MNVHEEAVVLVQERGRRGGGDLVAGRVASATTASNSWLMLVASPAAANAGLATVMCDSHWPMVGIAETAISAPPNSTWGMIQSDRTSVRLGGGVRDRRRQQREAQAASRAQDHRDQQGRVEVVITLPSPSAPHHPGQSQGKRFVTPRITSMIVHDRVISGSRKVSFDST